MKSEHIVKSFDEKLNQLNTAIAQMGGLAEIQLDEAVQALVRRDAEAAAHIIEKDKRIDALEHDVDSMTVRLLALSEPKAEVILAIEVALKITTDIEQIDE